MPRRPRHLQPTGVVEYGLVRHALIEAVKSGRLRREDICDAHPELLRAAAHLGRPAGHDCPVCDSTNLKMVTYVFGAHLPPGGDCPPSVKELVKLEKRELPVQCYSVDVCLECHFHHLARKWNAGGVKPRKLKGAQS